MICEKSFKSNKTSIFAQNYHGKWILFLDIVLESRLSFMLRTFLLQISEILLTYRAVSLHWKTFPFSFSRFKAFLTHLLINFIILKGLYSNLVCRKGFAIFLFLISTSGNQDGKIKKKKFFVIYSVSVTRVWGQRIISS